MIKKLLVAGAAMFAASGASAQVVDGGFEGAVITNANGYCYGGGNYNAPGCGAYAAWTLGGDTSGYQRDDNTAWPAVASPNGDIYAFLQSGYGAPGTITQNVTIGTTGLYAVNWLAASRPGQAGGQSYTLSFGGNQVFGGTSPIAPDFQSFTSSSQVLTAGSYALTFTALTGTGDNSVFLDAVSVAAVPEPAAWAMMIAGFGVVGGAMRRRRRSVGQVFA